MNVIDIVRGLVEDTVGNRGAVQNCKAELLGRRDTERRVDAVCRRLPPPQDRASA